MANLIYTPEKKDLSLEILEKTYHQALREGDDRQLRIGIFHNTFDMFINSGLYLNSSMNLDDKYYDLRFRGNPGL